MDTEPSTRVSSTFRLSGYVLKLNFVPVTTTFTLSPDTMKGWRLSLTISAYTSPETNTCLRPPAKESGYVTRESLCSHMREPSGRTISFTSP